MNLGNPKLHLIYVFLIYVQVLVNFVCTYIIIPTTSIWMYTLSSLKAWKEAHGQWFIVTAGGINYWEPQDIPWKVGFACLCCFLKSPACRLLFRAPLHLGMRASAKCTHSATWSICELKPTRKQHEKAQAARWCSETLGLNKAILGVNKATLGLGAMHFSA